MIRKITPPGAALAGAGADVEANQNRVVLQIGGGGPIPDVGGGGGAIEGHGLAGGHQLVLPQPEGHGAGIEGHAGAAGRRQDPAPVGVAAMDGAFHQGRATDRAGDRDRLGVAGRAHHLHLDQAGGAFAVAGDRPAQPTRHLGEAGLEGVKVLGV